MSSQGVALAPTPIYSAPAPGDGSPRHRGSTHPRAAFLSFVVAADLPLTRAGAATSGGVEVVLATRRRAAAPLAAGEPTQARAVEQQDGRRRAALRGEERQQGAGPGQQRRKTENRAASFEHGHGGEGRQSRPIQADERRGAVARMDQISRRRTVCWIIDDHTIELKKMHFYSGRLAFRSRELSIFSNPDRPTIRGLSDNS